MPAHLSRRAFARALPALAALIALPGRAAAAPAIHVVKDPGCGCCTAWIEILQAAGFEVTSQPLGAGDLNRYKRMQGVPADMASCHTATVDGYVIEGHVPPADIRRLLRDRPDARGLAVPGMPYGSPGMGPEHAREAYDVYLFKRDGSARVFSRYAAG